MYVDPGYLSIFVFDMRAKGRRKGDAGEDTEREKFMEEFSRRGDGEWDKDYMGGIDLEKAVGHFFLYDWKERQRDQ